MTDRLTLDAFTPLVGQKFNGKTSDGDYIELELTEAVPLPVHGNQPRQDPFSLVFRSPSEENLWQGMIQIRHARLGTADLFLVPISEDQKGRYFEALFN